MATTKKRINITVNQDVYNRVRGNIKNISAFVEKCLTNYIENGNIKYKKGVKTKITQNDIKKEMTLIDAENEKKAKQLGISKEDYLKRIQEIANYKMFGD